MRINLIVLFLFLSLGSFAQSIVNLPVAGSTNQVRAVNLRESGLIVLDKASDGLLRIQKLDTSLHVNWEISTEIPGKTNFIDEFFDGKFLYIILEPRDTRSYIILKISSAFAAFQRFELPLSKGFQYGFFAASDEVIAVGGVVKTEPFLALLETTPGASPRFISGGAKGGMDLQSLYVDEGTVHAAYINTVKKTSQIILREYDYSGKVLNSRNFPAKEGLSFLSLRYFEHSDGPIMVGNYGLGKSSNNTIPASQGIFLCRLPSGLVNYYDFSQFDRMFSFMSERQKDRLDKQVEKKKNKGREYNFDYRLFISGLQFVEDYTLVVGEVFQPEYRTRTYGGLYGLSPFYSSMYWGRPMLYNYYGPGYYGGLRNNQVFDGFRYLEGVIFALGPDGKMKWDYSFPYKNLKMYDLNPYLKVSQNHGNTLALFSQGAKLKISSVSRRGELLETREFDPESLDLQFRNRKSEFSNFEHWYGDVYYNWGVLKRDGANACYIQKIIP
jgi:hypothetical protein